MRQTPDRDVIDALDDQLDRMNTAAAKGVRVEEGIRRNTFRSSEQASEPLLHLTVLHPSGHGFIAVTERSARFDYAWSGESDDLDIIDDLLREGHLAVEDIEVDVHPDTDD